MKKFILAILALVTAGCAVDAMSGQQVSVATDSQSDANLASDAGSRAFEIAQRSDSSNEKTDTGSGTVGEVAPPEEVTLGGCVTDTDCNDQNGCTYDTCVSGQCIFQPEMYMVQFKGEDKPFNCAPCQIDADCDFKSKSFCESSGCTYGSCHQGAIAVPIGKCIKNRCGFKTVTCADGDISTFDTCDAAPSISSYNIPQLIEGECKHLTQVPNPYTECWCHTDGMTLECVSNYESTDFSSGEKIPAGQSTFKACKYSCGGLSFCPFSS